MVFEDKEFLVLGLGTSGMSATELLLKLGAKVYIFDDSLKNGIADNRLKKWKDRVTVVELEEIVESNFSPYCAIKSPGISNMHPVVLWLNHLHIRCISEIELAKHFCKGTVLAVTGSNGKTTTVSLLHHIMLLQGKRSRLLGNIGRPFSADAVKIALDEMVCLELSSFQLEDTFCLTPHVAAVLNLSPDHMDRYDSMQEYSAAKKRIFMGQSSTEYAVLNADDDMVCTYENSLFADVYYFSTKHAVRGCYVEQGNIYFQSDQQAQCIMPQSELLLVGEHNLSNALCAVTMAKLCNVEDEYIRLGLSTFHGVPHRLQLVKEWNGRTFFNDSKATNAASALAGMLAINKDTVVILGGSDKGETFEELFYRMPAHVSHAVLCGQTANMLQKAAHKNNFERITVCNTLRQATKIAYTLCKENGVVLLSPACASFDEFKNYEHRGRAFCKYVEELQ